MTLRLILIRHAKSSWSDPFADDHARPLNKRGRASAKAIGQWMAQNKYFPQVMLCSDAERTQETASLILPELHVQPELVLRSDLYLAPPQDIAAAIKSRAEIVVGVIGHNPGIGALANSLVSAPPDHPRFLDYPTCATSVIDFHEALEGRLLPGTGRCTDFIVPRDLIGTHATDAGTSHS